MIDTVILIVGFLCVGLVYSLCVIEYGLSARQHAFSSVVRKYVHQGPALHSIVLALVFFSAVASSVVSNQYNQQFEAAQQAVSLSPANTAALVIAREE